MSTLSLGYCPCPNDTFIFYGLVHGRIPGAPRFAEVLEDIATLNSLALEGKLDATKISFHAFAHLRDTYCLLHSGGALGRGCGPLVLARDGLDPAELKNLRIAIPGELTTAALLLRLFDPSIRSLHIMPFDQIMESVKVGRVDAGLIIHESRFTFQQFGLRQVIDLGEWWEETTGHPIPLGGILARRALGRQRIDQVDSGLKASVDYAHRHPDEVRDYVRAHAHEMEDEVIEAHIDLYVNDFTFDYGREGELAVFDLLRRAEEAEIVPRSDVPLFIEN